MAITSTLTRDQGTLTTIRRINTLTWCLTTRGNLNREDILNLHIRTTTRPNMFQSQIITKDNPEEHLIILRIIGNPTTTREAEAMETTTTEEDPDMMCLLRKVLRREDQVNPSS